VIKSVKSFVLHHGRKLKKKHKLFDIIYQFFLHFYNDSLYRNSIFLILSTFVMSGVGFFFWIIAARVYNAQQVGITTTILSITGLISSISLFGFNVSLISYLPLSMTKNKIINSSLILNVVGTLFISLIYFIGIQYFSESMMFIRNNGIFCTLFIVYTVSIGLSGLFDSVFIAYRSTHNILIKTCLFSLIRIVLPFLLFYFGTLGLFGSIAIAGIVSCIFSVVILIKQYHYIFCFEVDKKSIKEMAYFSLGNYVAGFISSLPGFILPIIILNNLGSDMSAYFYMAFMIIALLNIIPKSLAQSLFAEGSHSGTILKSSLKKVGYFSFAIMIPCVLITFFFGQYVLHFFGKAYAIESFMLLRIMSISVIFVTVNLIGESILNIRKEIKTLVFFSVFNASLVLGLSFVFIHLGLSGIGIAWIIAQGSTSLLYIIYYAHHYLDTFSRNV